MYSHTVNVPEDSVFFIADSNRRCQHFEVYVDDVSVGETDGTGELDNMWCGTPDDCVEKHGGSHGYFTIPKGKPTRDYRHVAKPYSG